MELKERAQKELEQEINRIKEFAAEHPDDDFAKANHHVLKELGAPWHCAGMIEMSGLVMWALSLQVDFAPPKYLIFSAAGGPDWAVSVFAGDVFGSFVVDPATLVDGKYRFSLSQATYEVGGCSFHLYDMDRKLLGTLTGVVGGIGASSISGIGKISH